MKLSQLKNEQFFLILVLLALLAVYVGVSFWSNGWLFSKNKVTEESPTTTPTSIWKKYENQEEGYSFEYPSNYLVKKIGSHSVTLRAHDGGGLADLLVIVKQDIRSLDAIVQDKVDGFVFRDYQKIVVSEENAYEGIGQGMVNSYEILVKNGENLYSLSFESGNGDTLGQNKAGLSQTQKTVLSTFSFIR